MSPEDLATSLFRRNHSTALLTQLLTNPKYMPTHVLDAIMAAAFEKGKLRMYPKAAKAFITLQEQAREACLGASAPNLPGDDNETKSSNPGVENFGKKIDAMFSGNTAAGANEQEPTTPAPVSPNDKQGSASANGNVTGQTESPETEETLAYAQQAPNIHSRRASIHTVSSTVSSEDLSAANIPLPKSPVESEKANSNGDSTIRRVSPSPPPSRRTGDGSDGTAAETERKNSFSAMGLGDTQAAPKPGLLERFFNKLGKKPYSSKSTGSPSRPATSNGWERFGVKNRSVKSLGHFVNKDTS